MLVSALNNQRYSVREVGVNILHRVRCRNVFADAELEKALLKNAFNDLDRALLSELVHGTLRQRGYLDHLLENLYRGDFVKCADRLKSILELSLYQVEFLDKVPHYAAINEGVEIAKRSGGQPWARLVNGILRAHLRGSGNGSKSKRDLSTSKELAIEYSHPEWLIQRFLKRYGEDATKKFCIYNNARPSLSLRINLKLMSRDAVLQALRGQGLSAKSSPYFPDFIEVTSGVEIASHELFQRGVVTVQDQSTAIPCHLVAPRPGEIILDMCAAPGGKSAYLAHLADDRATILASDISRTRLEKVRQNATRLQLKSVKFLVADGRTLQAQKIDKILLDAPCSGLGVLSRRSDLRWRRKPQEIENAAQVQLELLQNAADLLRPGGILVYSTCTLEPEETEAVAEAFLSKKKNFRQDFDFAAKADRFRSPDGAWRTLPFRDNIDGSYAIRFVKTSTR